MTTTASRPPIHNRMYGQWGNDMTSKRVEMTRNDTAVAAAARATRDSSGLRLRIGARAVATMDTMSMM